MSVTLFVVVGAAVVISACYVLATKSAIHAALAGQNTVVGLHDAAAETLVGDAKRSSTGDWQLTAVDDLTDAEGLLDCLEARGYNDRELVVLGNSCFAVRWR